MIHFLPYESFLLLFIFFHFLLEKSFSSCKGKSSEFRVFCKILSALPQVVKVCLLVAST